jgi:hypothetical protein
MFVKVCGCFYGHLHTIFHTLGCNISVPIVTECEDNYKIRAAAIHYFYIVQQITSRKLHIGSLKSFDQQLIHYMADFRQSP